jgi:hypothetical protein
MLDAAYVEVSLNARKGRARRFTAEELASPFKHCRVCNTTKPKTEFGIHRRYRDGLQAFCKECINARARQRRKGWSPEERERRREIARRYWDKRRDADRESRYGITGDQYRALLQEQGGCCGICGTTENYALKDMCVDHDHKTGAVRGLLCTRCNTSLGGFQDRPEVLEAAIEYLRRSQRP